MQIVRVRSGAPGAGIFVAPTGSDTTGDGSQANPFATVAKGISAATVLNAVYVYSGTYLPTSLTISRSNLTLQGWGPTKPILDANGSGGSGAGKVIALTNVTNVTIDGFELRNVRGSSNVHGIDALSAVSGCTISNNAIHQIHATAALGSAAGIALGSNATPGSAHDNLIQHNAIYDIGPGGESWGIWMLFSKNNTVDGNTIFCIRKEGVRDWAGYRNIFTNNHSFLNWNGLELENAVGAYTANNVCHHNIWGFNCKHVNDAAASDSAGGNPWGVQEWCKWYHNTSWNNLHAAMGIGMAPTPVADFIDVRDNIFGADAGCGTANLNDFRSTRGTNIIVDDNAYQVVHNNIYYDGFPSQTHLHATLADLQADTVLNWEAHGQTFAPTFADPDNGNYSVTNRSAMASGAALGDAWGAQVGAEPSVGPTHSYREFPVTVLSTPAPASVSYHASQFSNRNDDSYFLGAAGTGAGSFVCDFGVTTTWNVACHAIYSQGDPGCPKSIHLDVSDTNNGTDWVEVFAQVNPDNEQSSYKYLIFPGSATGRYVRFRYDSIFSGTQVNVADFGFGLITAIP